MKNIGIDLGSRYIKLVICNDQGDVLDKRIYSSVDFYRNYGIRNQNILQLDIKKLGISENDNIMSTGYGKHNICFENIIKLSEQKAHVYGAILQTGETDFILIDIGGQDTKVISVVNSKIVDIYMNDKCGASSGRYLENMAQILQMTMDEISQYYENPVEINNTCAIFGESEVLGKVFEGIPVERIAAGINYSVFNRIQPMITRHSQRKVIFVGGTACNNAIRSIIALETGKQIIVPKEPQFNGAIGSVAYKLSLQIV
ncbi:MAG: hypothetical protein A2Y40_01865 [Candidatus Margulisbacteria bacterium GWF2_35_9]|nr:MAG: hypothetical protein A2Y40_01865 [Candidatus Margulisbacteria bacterium GWF2_35_9]